jgi:hypothetical protein
MTAETNLRELLSTMKPELHPGEFVFTTISKDDMEKFQIEPWGWFREPEGITLILEKSEALSNQMDYAFPCRLITLTVHSSLDAVGFLAIITEKLAASGISVNAISAYFHDHLFVPVEKADQAMQILQQIMQEARVKND